MGSLEKCVEGTKMGKGNQPTATWEVTEHAKHGNMAPGSQPSSRWGCVESQNSN